MLSATGRPGLHIHDFQFNSEEVEGINWRGEIEFEHVDKIHYESTSQRHNTVRTADAIMGRCNRMLTGNKCNDLLESHPTAGRRCKEKRKRRVRPGQRRRRKGQNKRKEKAVEKKV